MTLDPLVLKVLKEQLALVLALTSPEIREAAALVAFYTAMIDAALDDPMDDEEEQEAMLAFLRHEQDVALSTYMSLVNEQM